MFVAAAYSGRCSPRTASTWSRGFFIGGPLNVSDASGREGATGGGRVTELVARPLLAALRPELGCVLQPPWRRGTRPPANLLTSVPFAPGYGVEIGLLVDTYDRLGTGTRSRRSTWVCGHTATGPLAELGPNEPSGRCDACFRAAASPTPAWVLTQFFVDGDGYTPRHLCGCRWPTGRR